MAALAALGAADGGHVLSNAGVTEGDFIAVRYQARGAPLRHERLVLLLLPNHSFTGVTPDGDCYEKDLIACARGSTATGRENDHSHCFAALQPAETKQWLWSFSLMVVVIFPSRNSQFHQMFAQAAAALEFRMAPYPGAPQRDLRRPRSHRGRGLDERTKRGRWQAAKGATRREKKRAAGRRRRERARALDCERLLEERLVRGRSLLGIARTCAFFLRRGPSRSEGRPRWRS
ncbi:unnamed protein product, partial [Prorocentrum cordatum]